MHRLRKYWNGLWLGALAALSISPARAAPAPDATSAPPIERVADIRARLLARDAETDTPPAQADQADTLAQLNRRNWPNWSNWNNWLKWSKF